MTKVSLKKLLATTDNNKFNYKDKIGEFNYIDIKDLVNNIKNNTISKIDAKNNLNTLNKTKNAEIIKYKKRTSTLFNDLLTTILVDKILMPSKDDVNKNENENENENEN